MSFWFYFERPNLDLSSYGDGATISWAERELDDGSTEAIDPNDDNNWTEDNGGALTYEGLAAGPNSLVPTIMYRSLTLVPSRSLALNLRYSPVISKGLNRDFMWHLGGDDAIASAAGNLLISGLQVTYRHWFFGLEADMPVGYTIRAGPVGVGEASGWIAADKLDAAVTIAPMSLALVGVKQVAGEFTHTIVFIGASGASTETDVARPADITDLVLAYLANKNLYMFFEIMPVNPFLIDILTDATASNFRSYFKALVDDQTTWQYIESPLFEWLAYGEATVTEFEWGGISLVGTHVNYSGDFPLPSEARVPPGGLPPMT